MFCKISLSLMYPNTKIDRTTNARFTKKLITTHQISLFQDDIVWFIIKLFYYLFTCICGIWHHNDDFHRRMLPSVNMKIDDFRKTMYCFRQNLSKLFLNSPFFLTHLFEPDLSNQYWFVFEPGSSGSCVSAPLFKFWFNSNLVYSK